MVSRKFNIKIFRFFFVFRYKGDERCRPFDTMFNKISVGVWVKKSNAVGNPNLIGKLIGDKTHVPTFLIGIDFLITKMWVDINFGKTLTLEI